MALPDGTAMRSFTLKDVFADAPLAEDESLHSVLTSSLLMGSFGSFTLGSSRRDGGLERREMQSLRDYRRSANLRRRIELRLLENTKFDLRFTLPSVELAFRNEAALLNRHTVLLGYGLVVVLRCLAMMTSKVGLRWRAATRQLPPLTHASILSLLSPPKMFDEYRHNLVSDSSRIDNILFWNDSGDSEPEGKNREVIFTGILGASYTVIAFVASLAHEHIHRTATIKNKAYAGWVSLVAQVLFLLTMSIAYYIERRSKDAFWTLDYFGCLIKVSLTQRIVRSPTHPNLVLTCVSFPFLPSRSSSFRFSSRGCFCGPRLRFWRSP